MPPFDSPLRLRFIIKYFADIVSPLPSFLRRFHDYAFTPFSMPFFLMLPPALFTPSAITTPAYVMPLSLMPQRVQLRVPTACHRLFLFQNPFYSHDIVFMLFIYYADIITPLIRLRHFLSPPLRYVTAMPTLTSHIFIAVIGFINMICDADIEITPSLISHLCCRYHAFHYAYLGHIYGYARLWFAYAYFCRHCWLAYYAATPATNYFHCSILHACSAASRLHAYACFSIRCYCHCASRTPHAGLRWYASRRLPLPVVFATP